LSGAVPSVIRYRGARRDGVASGGGRLAARPREVHAEMCSAVGLLPVPMAHYGPGRGLGPVVLSAPNFGIVDVVPVVAPLEALFTAPADRDCGLTGDDVVSVVACDGVGNSEAPPHDLR